MNKTPEQPCSELPVDDSKNHYNFSKTVQKYNKNKNAIEKRETKKKSTFFLLLNRYPKNEHLSSFKNCSI